MSRAFNPQIPPGAEGSRTVLSGATPESAPTTALHGVNCRGFRFAVLGIDADSITAGTVKIYTSLDDGATWLESPSDEITLTTKDHPASYEIPAATMITARVTALTGTGVTLTWSLA